MSAITPEKKLAIWRAIEVEGLTIARCSSVFRVPPEQCREIHAEVSKENEGRSISRTAYRQQLQVERVEELIRKSISSMEESSKPVRKKVIRKIRKRKVTEDGQVYYEDGDIETITSVEEQKTDPRWHTVVKGYVGVLNSLEGLEAPKQVNVSVSTVHEMYLALPDDEDQLKLLSAVHNLEQQGVLHKIEKKDHVDAIDVESEPVKEEPKASEEPPPF